MSESFPSSAQNNYEFQEQESGLIIAEDRRNHAYSQEQTTLVVAESAVAASPTEKTSSHYDERTILVGGNPLIIAESVKNSNLPATRATEVNTAEMAGAPKSEAARKSQQGTEAAPSEANNKETVDQKSEEQTDSRFKSKPVSEDYKKRERIRLAELNAKAARKRMQRIEAAQKQITREEKESEKKIEAMYQKIDDTVAAYDARVAARSETKATDKKDSREQEIAPVADPKIEIVETAPQAEAQTSREKRKRKLMKRAAEWVLKGYGIEPGAKTQVNTEATPVAEDAVEAPAEPLTNDTLGKMYRGEDEAEVENVRRLRLVETEEAEKIKKAA